MGQSLNPLRTHEEVPDDVKDTIIPVDYTPAPPESRPTDHDACEDCRELFGWFCYSTNCDWCGRQLCTRCCPSRHLLGGNPGCTGCTNKAFRIRREEMLNNHLEDVGMRPKHPHSPAMGVPVATSASHAAAQKPGECAQHN
ncbi:hypothetical protein ABL78_3095 [Leptomonas seymouri]|uniref:FYVE-type domain-containing protein n=1 Tax=Leptomonas seymouri TaxID=5684 RepID=A0A0N0P6M0_LEPSE|nr:hypothetical protein ABL78_3095 [Leptomonas seymouri]|eukprot:KPI87796.1 hypothetical protein ABL78_3095 [Leptomonas seymouri]